jgi:hypothetical protein
MVVGGQRPGDRGAGLVVVPDGGGHGQDALADADGDALEGPSAVGFEVELAFEGVVDRFDQLPDRFEQRLAVAGDLILAGGPQQRDAPGGQVSFGLAAGEALVGDQDQAGPGDDPPCQLSNAVGGASGRGYPCANSWQDGGMALITDRDAPDGRLRKAIVLGTTEDACTVFAAGQRAVVPYADPFPKPRAERVIPGHLVAVAAAANGSAVVVWRWFDAVVLEGAGGSVSLWEPAHGVVLAEPRDSQRTYRPGTRAYLSSGLPGAECWVAGPVVDRAENADVDLDEVEQFFTGLGLWASLT